MGFKRTWDSSCPRVWRRWEENGRKWVIQDLPPEDDKRALQILKENLCTDEVLCSLSKLYDDETSLASMMESWVEGLKYRTSLGCYTEVDGRMTLVALNVCIVNTIQERIPNVEVKGKAWKNVYNALEYLKSRFDVFKYLEVDSLLHAMGLVASREFRGMGLGTKILDAREPLCKALGLKATATVFTGPASQKSAAKAGFSTIYTASMKDLADSGLDYPRDENRLVKLMIQNDNTEKNDDDDDDENDSRDEDDDDY